MSSNKKTIEKNTKKRILILSLAYHPVIGGAEVAVKEITDRLPEYEFDMVTLRFDADHPAEEKVGNVCVYRINGSKLLFPMQASMFAKELHGKRPYDAVWSIMAAHAGFAALYFKASFPEVKYILTLQEGKPLEYIKRKTFFITPIFKRVFTRADMVQAISTYLGDWASVMGYAGKVEVIPNGVDTKKFQAPKTKTASRKLRESLGFEEDDTVLVTTSRLVEKNAIWDVIRALPYLSKRVKFLIVGSGPESKGLRKLAKDLGVEERVNFAGHVSYDDVPPYLHASDIFIRPSLSEGFGNSFIEAMAAGLPVIATPVGGIVDFLENEETGLFANTRDPESIADKVRRLTKDPELGKRLVANAQKMVKECYEWDLVAKEMKTRVFDRIG